MMLTTALTEATESPAVAATTSKADAEAWADALDAASSGRGSWCPGSSSESVSQVPAVRSSRGSAAGCCDDTHAMVGNDQPPACRLSSVEVPSDSAQGRHVADVIVNELGFQVNCCSSKLNN